MKKRFLSLVLLIAITCALCLSANASASSTENSVLSFDDDKTSSYCYGQNFIQIDPSYVCCIPAPIDYVPDEILNGNTKDLLEWFLNCNEVRLYVSGALLSSPRIEPIDFSVYLAYQELITRADLITSIRAFVTENIENAIELRDEISALLQQPEIKAFVGDATAKTVDIFGSLNSKQFAESKTPVAY